MAKLCIVGGSTFGLTVAEVAKRTGLFTIEGFFDDNLQCLSSSAEARFLGNLNSITLDALGTRKLVIAVGTNLNRRLIYRFLQSRGLISSLVSVVDPASSILGNVEIGAGSIIFPGAVIGPNTMLGDCSIINGNSFIGAQCRIGHFSNICPGACIGASSRIDDGVYVGMRACILQGLKVAPWTTIGAGAVVLDDLPDTGIFIGIPARKTSAL